MALQGAGLVVHAIKPRALDGYRERHGQAGNNSDPVLGAASVPALGKGADQAQGRGVAALLRGCRRRNDPALVEQILRDLHADARRQHAPVKLALGPAVLSLRAVLTGMHTAVERLEQAQSEQFDQHPLAPVLRSAPGLGSLLGARVLDEIGARGRWARLTVWRRRSHPNAALAAPRFLAPIS